jgi:hypothetical protein
MLLTSRAAVGCVHAFDGLPYMCVCVSYIKTKIKNLNVIHYI